MKLSRYFIPTLREAPSECDTTSAKLMFRAGMIRKIASGIYEWLPFGLKVLKKVEQIIREEMDNISGLELWLPHLLPKEPWQQTGRWYIYGKELFRLKDRKNSDFCLSPTAEEIITELVKCEIRSYRQLPVMFYQFGTKFRDEIRPRFGVIRAREFYMKDAYSFHRDEQDAEKYYRVVYDAYCRIFSRCGIKYIAVEAATGAIGGKFSHEFMVVSKGEENLDLAGEETIVYCNKCGYAANVEKAECLESEFSGQANEELKEIEEIFTPGLKSVQEVANSLQEDPKKFIKSLVYTNSDETEFYLVLVRGDYEINEAKLKENLSIGEIELANNDIVEKVFGVEVGFLGPVGKKDDKIKIIADYSIKNIVNAISGANKKDYHLKNINIKRDFNVDFLGDFRKITVNDICPKCRQKSLVFSKGIEVGHTFKLGQKYSKSMKASFLDENGKENFFVMGCYGIGVSRVVAAFIEQNNDKDGIIWNTTISPFNVFLLPVDYEDPIIKKVTDEIYDKLLAIKIDVLLDDRDERPGVKFKDCDLIGIPVRITVSKKNLPDNLEIYIRKDKTTKIVSREKILDEITQIIELLK